MGSRSTRQERLVSIGLLLTGYSALLGGLFGLTAKPLLGVLLMLGGMAISICSANELMHEPTSGESASPSSDDL